MIHQTRGIVFKTIKFSESSVISKIYTERFGLQSYIINGVRSSKSKFKAAFLQSLSLLDMEVYYRENRNLSRVKEFRAAFVFSSIPFDLVKGSVGLFMIEVLNKSIHEEEANVSLFNFIFNKIKGLDELKKVSPGFLIRFLLDLSAHLGFYPNGTFTSATPNFDLKEGTFVNSGKGHPFSLDESVSSNLSALVQRKDIEITSFPRKLLLEALLQYYQLHIPNFSRPKSLRVLEEVFRN